MDSIKVFLLSDPSSPMVIGGWILLLGVPVLWFAGQIGVVRGARRMGFYTPVLTASLGAFILFHLQRWPFG